MEQVKQLIDAGASIPTAIKESLRNVGFQSVGEFTRKYRLNRSQMSNVIAGNLRPTGHILSALVKELGGTPGDWAELLWLAGKPSSAVHANHAVNASNASHAAHGAHDVDSTNE